MLNHPQSFTDIASFKVVLIRLTDEIDKLDKSFSTIFIIVSIFDTGIILSGQLQIGETSAAARSAALFQLMIPILVLVLVWWIGVFYNRLEFKFAGWFFLFTLIFYAIVFVLIMSGIDLFLRFNVYYLVLGYVLSPLPAFIVLRIIMKRYYLLLNRHLSRREKWLTGILVSLFSIYWVIVPWDLVVFVRLLAS